MNDLERFQKSVEEFDEVVSVSYEDDDPKGIIAYISLAEGVESDTTLVNSVLNELPEGLVEPGFERSERVQVFDDAIEIKL